MNTEHTKKISAGTRCILGSLVRRVVVSPPDDTNHFLVKRCFIKVV